MFTFCDALHETKQKRKQTIESAQYGLEIIFKFELDVLNTICATPVLFSKNA